MLRAAAKSFFMTSPLWGLGAGSVQLTFRSTKDAKASLSKNDFTFLNSPDVRHGALGPAKALLPDWTKDVT
jgi:hypothetical protein